MEQGRKRRWLRAPSPSMVVACIALVIAMGGTSYAAVKLPANSVGTKQIKKSAVTNAKVKSATLTGAKIKDGTLTGAKVQDGSLAAVDLANGVIDPAKVGSIPGARVRCTTATTAVDNTSRFVSYDAVDFNVGGVFDSSKPTRMTAPVAGRYLITASVRWDSNPAGRRALALEVNGNVAQIARSNVSAFFTGGSGVANLSPEQTASTVYRLNAGDYVEVIVYQNSGSDLSLMTGVDNGVSFLMEWVAP